MKIKQIYLDYKIPPNLQTHMLRVTSLTNILINAWTGDEIDRKTLIKACLFHDMGNLLKFDLVNQVHFLGDEAKNLAYWKRVKAKMLEKYGSDEHQATIEICQEIGLDEKALFIVKNKEFSNFDNISLSHNWELKLAAYADHRIGPLGILSLRKRFAEQAKRYKLSRPKSAHLSEKREILANAAFRVEKQLMKYISRNVHKITNAEIAASLYNFLDYSV
ncbi:MAG TPA: HD domain-containing protein [Candidatus Dojkabacteria bacterium]|nr:HD domain-containing protein [Candidatus Dojkabacteria bacterium]